MADVTYTSPQKYAIEADCGNLLVSAAAGSGKTFTLSAHIVELVKTGKAQIGEILVVTFTRSAAADMKRKIAESLKKAAAAAKADDRVSFVRLSDAAAGVQSADISTMHSFLYKILKRCLQDAGLPQDSRLISNDALLDRIRSEMLSDTIGDMFSSSDGEFLYLADAVSTVRDTSSIDATLASVARRLSSYGLDASALGKYADLLEREVTSADAALSSPFGAPIAERIDAMLSHYHTVFSAYREDVGEKYKKLYQDLCILLDWIDHARAALDARELGRLSELFTGQDLPKYAYEKEIAELAKEIRRHRDAFKKDIKSIGESLASFTVDEIMLSRDSLIRLLRCMESVLGRYFAAYRKKKRDLSMLDFGDLEEIALALLTDENGRATPLAAEIGRKYKYVFIDEYQDTNRVQDAIFSAISQDARRFMVGDIKQAIYNFRGADPSVFSSYRERWETVDPETDGGYPFERDGGRVLLMSDNFRSDEPVTELTNAVSDLIMPHGNIPYTAGDSLICSKKNGRGEGTVNAEVCLIEQKTHRGGDDGSDEPERGGDREAEYVAARIAGMLGRQMGNRVIEAGDIAVLVRTNSGIAAFASALADRNIPVYIEREAKISESPAVMLIMCLLGFVDNPLRDVYAAGALRSPVFGFGMDDLISVRESAGARPLYMGVVECARADDGGELAAKCRNAVGWIEREKIVSRGMNPSKYLEYLTDLVDLFAVDGIRENGAERSAVNRLFAIAGEFEASSSSPSSRGDLSAFIDYAEDTLDENRGEKRAKSAGNAVTVMTIHKSKGLEFPVVFVSRCGDVMNKKGNDPNSVSFDKDLGVGMSLPDESGLAVCNTFFSAGISEKLAQASKDEEMRTLYVALSRAEKKLIVTAKMQKLETLDETVDTAAAVCDRYAVRRLNHYIDWVMLALRKHPCRMTTVCRIADGQPLDNADEIAAASTDGEVGAEERVRIADFDERAAFVYPYEHLSRLPAKLTVSKLSPNILDDEDEEAADISSALDGKDGIHAPADADEKVPQPLDRPSFMTGRKYASASERGSATHVFMQFADYARLAECGARAELDRLVGERFISHADAELVELWQIERFAESTLMDKLLRSDMIKREFRFNVRMAAERFTHDEDLAARLSESGETVTVQGVVDCLFRDPDAGELTLIDYKTDRLTEEERQDSSLAEEKLRRRHKNQLTYYKDICAEMFGEPIPHAYVYSTVMGRLVEI